MSYVDPTTGKTYRASADDMVSRLRKITATLEQDVKANCVVCAEERIKVARRVLDDLEEELEIA